MIGFIVGFGIALIAGIAMRRRPVSPLRTTSSADEAFQDGA